MKPASKAIGKTGSSEIAQRHRRALELRRNHTGSFHWIGERHGDGSATWQRQADFFARRAGKVKG